MYCIQFGLWKSIWKFLYFCVATICTVRQPGSSNHAVAAVPYTNTATVLPSTVATVNGTRARGRRTVGYTLFSEFAWFVVMLRHVSLLLSQPQQGLLPWHDRKLYTSS